MPRTTGTRERLLAAARVEFARHGYSRTSHADLAFAAGIGRTTFYEHFPSKEELLTQLVEEDLPGVIDGIVRSIPPDLPIEDRLSELTVRMIEFVATDHLGLILHTEVPRLSPEAQYRIARAHEGLAVAFMETYREGVAAGLLRPLPGRLAGRLVEEVVMTTGRLLMRMDDPKQHMHEMASAAAEFLLHGLAR